VSTFEQGSVLPSLRGFAGLSLLGPLPNVGEIKTQQLRVYPESFCGKTGGSGDLAVAERRIFCRGSGQFTEHQLDCSYTHHRSTTIDSSFVVLAQAAIAAKPSEGPLDHSPLRQTNEPPAAFRSPHRLQPPTAAVLGHPLVELVVVILVVGPNRVQPGEVFLAQLGEQFRGGSRIAPKSRFPPCVSSPNSIPLTRSTKSC